MDNLNFTISNVPDSDKSFNNESKKEDIIQINKKSPVSQKIKLYLSIYAYSVALIISIWIGNGFSDPLAGFLIMIIISSILMYLYISAYYRSLGFLVTNNSITLYEGVFLKKSKTILFETVQTMESKSGIIMSMLGIVNFKISITIPNQININQNSITRVPDFNIMLTPEQADWLTNFISNTKKGS